MKRDDLGICLSRHMLVSHMQSTFTCVRAYEVDSDAHDDVRVMMAFPQMSGKDVLLSMQGDHELEWRAEHYCPCHHHY
ncbi:MULTISPECIES: hypothetical protein [Vibrio]|uniref:Cation transport ATPase n=2 Tax=Vibrio TaxID=662 RepID=A0A7X4LL92_9VIBR|nr:MULTISPECIES: hypothetical protein [Vibrio]MBF9000194.1 hypothetical protein [Vibrio nitrifigilis]MZI94050.1 hypothetical protein [Vibrio eleionomae]